MPQKIDCRVPRVIRGFFRCSPFFRYLLDLVSQPTYPSVSWLLSWVSISTHVHSWKSILSFVRTAGPNLNRGSLKAERTLDGHRTKPLCSIASGDFAFGLPSRVRFLRYFVRFSNFPIAFQPLKKSNIFSAHSTGFCFCDSLSHRLGACQNSLVSFPAGQPLRSGLTLQLGSSGFPFNLSLSVSFFSLELVYLAPQFYDLKFLGTVFPVVFPTDNDLRTFHRMLLRSKIRT